MVTKLGLYNINDNGKNVLMYNGKRISTKLAGTLRRFGLHVNDGSLKLDSSVISSTSVPNPRVKAKLDNVYFGDVQLVEKNECVNITEEDYNRLLSGEVVDGYKSYSPDVVYNIVDNPASSPVVIYDIIGDTIVFSGGETAHNGPDMVYNSVAGELAENEEDPTDTVENTDCPYVHVRYFNPVVSTGDAITLEYFVDTRKMASIQYATLHDTFTFVVSTPYSTVKQTTQTTYAGFFKITLPAFHEAGIKWFSVRCIDSNGVGSEEQFFDVMVKAPHTDVVYTMTEADLEPFEYNGNTYQIVPDDETVSVAIANKAALSAFFAKVKASGYDKVVMLNRVYWIDYHNKNGQRTLRDGRYNGGDYITFPNYFTIDLNHATIATTQCNDLNQAYVIRFYQNIDTHLVNGKIKGNYSGFDFGASYNNTNNSTEWLAVTAMTASKFCSFEGLDISESVGFEATLEPLATNYAAAGNVVLTDGKRIDLATGSVVDALGYVLTDEFNVSGNTVLSFGRNGGNQYLNMGPEREFFYCFYDANNNYIGFIKSHFYRTILSPANARKMRIFGYGKIYSSSVGGDTDWMVDRSGDIGGTLMVFSPQLCRNILYKNCYWHDTRTIAIGNFTAKGVLVDGCTYKDIAVEPSSNVVTPALGDFEDSWQWMSNVTMRNCKWIQSNGYSELIVYYADSFEYNNNSGISVTDHGGIECGVFEGDSIPNMAIERNRSCYYPNVVYRNNNIGNLSISYGRYRGRQITWTHHQAERIVAMTDSTINKECRYDNLLLRRCRNGNIIVD